MKLKLNCIGVRSMVCPNCDYEQRNPDSIAAGEDFGITECQSCKARFIWNRETVYSTAMGLLHDLRMSQKPPEAPPQTLSQKKYQKRERRSDSIARKPEEQQELITRREVAKRWGVCTRTIGRYHDLLKPVSFSRRLKRYRIDVVIAVEKQLGIKPR